jgi:hypothetical protein
MIRLDYKKKTIAGIITGGVLTILVVAYALFQSRNLIIGPEIKSLTPSTDSTFTSPLVTVAGVAQNVSYISLNGRAIFVDPEGNFSEQLLLSPGYNLWNVSARDKFGRTISKNIELVFSKT